jgi:AcrR family transcriptional regulator
MSSTSLTDRRILRTKEAIRDAVIDLIAEKGFEAVSVSDISERANINRGTFYLHYKDKYDLLEQIEAGIIQEMKVMIGEVAALDPLKMRDIDEPLPMIVAMFEFIAAHAALMRCVLGLKGNIAFQDRVKKAIEETFLKTGFFTNLKDEDLFVPREYFTAYIISAHLGVVQSWLQKGCVEPPREMALLLSKLSFYGPIYTFGIGNPATDA